MLRDYLIFKMFFKTREDTSSPSPVCAESADLFGVIGGTPRSKTKGDRRQSPCLLDPA